MVGLRKSILWLSFIVLLLSGIVYVQKQIEMPSLSAARSFISSVKFENNPVAIFVGGTSGIGQHMAQRMVQLIRGPAHIIISGRNAESAEKVIEFMKKEDSEKTYEFIPCDVSKMKKVREFTDDIAKKVDKVNYLVITSGFLSFDGRTETEDGIDVKLATHFYGRFLTTYRMIPLLQKAADNGEDARVLSVLDAGGSFGFHKDDLDLKHNYGLKAAADAATLYNDLVADKFSTLHPKISFNHAGPGFVSTNIGRGLPWYARIPATLLLPFSTSADDSADYLLSGFLSKDRAKGWHLISNRGNPVDKTRFHNDENRDLVWDHAINLTKADQ
eukprot:TRINITY_DN271_c0_g1_i1.p1 TRINITY_DN271_c0_g1~~TRINITY_DN271_c0_g1_i1.p1  ORF type:complete len:330 (+),score=83.83 TRINITY_DN271_c0_g1_i1:63-1052(+)